MKTLMGKIRFAGVLGALCLLATGRILAEEAKIDEGQVKALLKAVDEACIKKDTAALMSKLTADAHVTVVIKGAQGKTNKLEWNRTEYEAQLKQAMAVMEDYQYERRDVKISIAENGLSAKATSNVFEKAAVRGRKVSTENHETATITIKDGKLLVEKLEDELVSMKSE